MNAQGHRLDLEGTELTLRPEGAVWWAARAMLVVSDLHLGKAERMARRTGALFPPYESADTLARLALLVDALGPAHVVCLGDSFDDLAAARTLPDAAVATLAALMAGRRWTWVLGNHDPGPVEIGGACISELQLDGLTLRHIAQADVAGPEVSGHFHPKAGLRGLRRPAFVTDGRRLILPAFGTYTGGLDAADPAIADLMGQGARAILTGPTPASLPLTACTRAPGGPARLWHRTSTRG